MKTSVKLILAFVVGSIATVVILYMMIVMEYKKNVSSAPMAEVGVWGSEDIELVRTSNISMIFRRFDNRIYSSLIEFEPFDDNKVKAKTICHVVFDSEKVISKQIITHADSIIDNSYVGKKDGHHLNLIIDNENPLAEDHSRYNRLLLVESLTPCEKPTFFKADTNTIGDCLQQWSLGASISVDGEQISAQIGTNRHTFIYMVTGNMIYCRAARIRSNNNGSCFAQNIRLMNNPMEHTAFFELHNANLIRSDLVIDNSKFDTTKCIYAEEGIYWSLLNFGEDIINLQGCGGEIYTNVPNSNNLEYFEFIKY